jgi:hypothetical protein
MLVISLLEPRYDRHAAWNFFDGCGAYDLEWSWVLQQADAHISASQVTNVSSRDDVIWRQETTAMLFFQYKQRAVACG